MVVRVLQPATVADVEPQLEFQEFLGLIGGVRSLLIGFGRMIHGVVGHRAGRFKAGRVEREFRAEQVGPRAGVDEMRDLAVPQFVQLGGFGFLAFAFQRGDQFGQKRLVHRRHGVGGPAARLVGLHRHRPVGHRRVVGQHEIFVRVGEMHHRRIRLGDLIHAEIHQHDVGIIVDAPQMFAVQPGPAHIVRKRLRLRHEVGRRRGIDRAVLVPVVERAVNAVRIRLLLGHLHAAGAFVPFVAVEQILLDVKLDAVDFLLVGEEDVFRGDIGGRRVAGVVAGVGQPGRQAVAVDRAAQHFVNLVPIAVDAVPPLARIGVLHAD